MAAEPGGIASKLGTIYERRYAVEQLLRLVSGRVIRLRWEPASGEAGGADIELEDTRGVTEHVQLKRQNRAVAEWTPAALDREGVLQAAARVTDSSPNARFAFVSSDPVPHLKDICDQLKRHNGTEAEFVRDRITRPPERRACFDELLRRWSLTIGSDGDEAKAVRRLRAMSFRVLDRGDEGEEHLNLLLQASLTGDPATASALLAAFLEQHLGRHISAQSVLDHLAAKGVLPRDLSRDPSLPTAMLALRTTFVDALRSRLVAGTWIPRAQVTDIVNKATADAPPRVILLHGKPGAGKSGAQLRIVEELIARGVQVLPLSLSTQPPQGSVLQYGESLGLKATPAAALRAVAGDQRAVLLVDQLDALRLTTSGATATWSTCATMLGEAALDAKTVLIVACRTFDLENDANIKRWKETIEKRAPGAVISVKIGDLSEADVKPVLQAVGVDYGTLPIRLQQLLLHPNTLDAWHRLVVRGSTRRDFATQTQLLSALIDALRAEAVRDHGSSDQEVYDTLDAARTHMERTGRLSVPTSVLDAHRGGLKACCGAGLMVQVGGTVSFPHQSYYDHLVAVAALGASGASSAQIVAWVKQDQSLERRDQLRQLLFLLHDEQPAVAASVSGSLLRDEKVRFHLKQLVLAVLRDAEPISREDVALVSELVRDVAWREHIIGRVLWRSVAWFDALFVNGIWTALIAGAEDDEKARWLRTALMVMEHRPAEVDQLLQPVLATPGSTDLMAKALWWDPAEDSPIVAALRDAQIRAGKWAVRDMMLDRVAKKDPARTIRLIDSMIRGLLRRAARTIEADNDEHINGLREGSLDKEVARAVRAQAPTSYPALARLLRLCERLQQACTSDVNDLDDLTPRYFKLSSFFRDLLEPLKGLCAHSIAGLADRNNGDLGAVLARTVVSPSLSRAIASGLALSPDTASDQAIDWLLADPQRLTLKEGFGSDESDLSREIVRRHSQTCSAAALARLESALLKLMPSDEKDRYKYLLDNYLTKGQWGHWDGGRYFPLVNPVGRAQHALLGGIAAGRRSPQVVERLRLWDSKFGGPAPDTPEVESRGGWVGSPIPSDRIDRLTDRQWLDIVSRRWTRRWKQVGPDQIAESSPEHFANDMKSVAAKQPQRFVQLVLRFPDDAPLVYLSRLWDALSDRAVDTESCSAAELDALIARTIATRDRYTLVAACRAVENHPNAQWGKSVWSLLDLAVTHDDPPVGDYSVHEGNGTKRRPDVETTSLNCVRGVAAAALAALAWNNSERCATVAERAAPLANDPHPAVRVAAAHTACAVYTVDRDAGMRMLLKIASMPSVSFPTGNALSRARAHVWNWLCTSLRAAIRRLTELQSRDVDNSQQSQYERVLSGRWLNRLAGYGRWSHRGILRELFSRMARSSEPEVAKQGAHWVTAERFQFRASKGEYRRCRTGSEIQRQGIAETLAHLVRDDHADRAAAEADLVRLFDDSSESVRAAAANVFRADGILQSDVGSRLASAFVRSKAFAENSEDLIWPVSHQAVDLVGYREVVFASADRFATELAEQTRNMQNRLGMAGRELSALLLRLYDAATKLGDRELADQCLDRWDALLENRVGDSDAHLESLLG
jgi:hypothetical protein